MRHIEVDKNINLCEVGYVQYKHIKMTQTELTIWCYCTVFFSIVYSISISIEVI